MIPHTSVKSLLKDMLSGKVSGEALRKMANGQAKDYGLLTRSELEALQEYESRYEKERALKQLFSIYDLKRYRLLQLKATPGVPSRKMLDLVDLTILLDEDPVPEQETADEEMNLTFSQ